MIIIGFNSAEISDAVETTQETYEKMESPFNE